MNLPNKLTLLRVIMIPFFVVFMLMDGMASARYIALALFVVASFTDFLDGNIARKRNLVTNFGKFMDAVKDGVDPKEAMDKARTHYGRVTKEDGMVKLIDPRKE